MRIPLNLLALLPVIHFVYTLSTPYDIHCNFQYRFGIYYCSLDDVNITTETIPLQFFNVHLPDYSDANVTGIDALLVWPRNVSIRVIHSQWTQQFPNVQVIDFTDSLLETVLADSFERCDELIALHLDRNPLTSIPPQAFANCQKLQTLGLAGSSPISVQRESFFGLQNLRTLRIGRLTVSNTAFEYLSLAQLHLTFMLGIDSNALRHMTQLETIDISDSQLSFSVIQEAIDGMGSLSRITLNRNQFTSLDFEFFEQFTQLEEFELVGNQLTSIPANSFRNYRSLIYLGLNDNQISVLTNETFSGAQSLMYLFLHNNRLVHLPPYAFHGLINLNLLMLTNNALSQIDADAFNGLENLDTLYMNNAQISSLTDGMFEPLKNLQVLHMMSSNIESLPPNVFSPLTKLRDLHLAGNNVIRLNSNSFDYLPLLNRFMIEGWTRGINEIERNFFNNFPILAQFGGVNNLCFSGNINITEVDFKGVTVFDRCFSNWDDPNPTTTTTTVSTTTEDNSGVTGTAKFWVLVTMLIVIIVTTGN